MQRPVSLLRRGRVETHESSDDAGPAVRTQLQQKLLTRFRSLLRGWVVVGAKEEMGAGQPSQTSNTYVAESRGWMKQKKEVIRRRGRGSGGGEW
jgi:uncharacterized lipoprotein YmbA